jgi:hypothetical protein
MTTEKKNHFIAINLMMTETINSVTNFQLLQLVTKNFQLPTFDRRSQ